MKNVIQTFLALDSTNIGNKKLLYAVMIKIGLQQFSVKRQQKNYAVELMEIVGISTGMLYRMDSYMLIIT